MTCVFHRRFDPVHGFLHKLQLCLFLGGEVFHHHCLQSVGVNSDAAIEDRNNGHDGHNDDNDNSYDNSCF